MDGRPQAFEGRASGAVGTTKQLSESREGITLSRASAERRLGDRSLSSQRFGPLALLAAQARGRAPHAILPWLPRLRSAAGRLSRARRRESELQQGRNPVFDDSQGRIGDPRQQRSRPLARGHAGSGQAGRDWPHAERGRTLRSDRIFEDAVAASGAMLWRLCLLMDFYEHTPVSLEQRRARHEGIERRPELRAIAVLLLQDFMFRTGDDEMRTGAQMIGELLDRRRRDDGVAAGGQHQDRLTNL